MPAAKRVLAVLAAVVASLVALPGLAQDATGYDGFIQSGTCAEPTDDIHLDIDNGDDEFAFQPYTPKGVDPGDAGAYVGVRTVPGFGPLTLLSDEDYFLAITDAGGTVVACGDILVPQEKTFIDQGLILVGLLPAEGSNISGVAIVRAPAPGSADHLTTVEVILIVSEPGTATPVAEATPNA